MREEDKIKELPLFCEPNKSKIEERKINVEDLWNVGTRGCGCCGTWCDQRTVIAVEKL